MYPKRKDNYELSAIEETQGDERTKLGDNTLMKYFFPDEQQKSKVMQKEEKKLTPEKLEKMFRKPIKLRNALKQCYWDRSVQNFSRLQVIRVDELIPDVLLGSTLLQEVQNYLLNDFYDVYNGSLKMSKDAERRTVNFQGIDVVASETGSMEGINFVMNPKLISRKTESKAASLRMLEKVYNNIRGEDKNKNLKTHEIFNFFIYFNREKSLENNNLTLAKVYCTFPNINLELKRINKITLSKTGLSKYLVSGKIDSSVPPFTPCKNGYLAMSSKHRLITLPSEDSSLKEILFGLWIHFPEDKLSKHISENTFEDIIQRRKSYIYQHCLHFLVNSKKIEVINSPSPDEGVFLLVLFFTGYQAFFEVKLLPNEKEKFYNYNSDNNNSNRSSNNILGNFTNEWLLVKKKVGINRGGNLLVKMNLKQSGSNERIVSMNSYIRKKFMIEEGKSLKGTSASLSKGKRENFNNGTSTRTNFKDPLNEIFEEEDDDPYYYDFPLAMEKVNSITNNISKNISKTNLRKNLMPSTNQYATITHFGSPNFNPEESETLTISSSKGTSVKSIHTNNPSQFRNTFSNKTFANSNHNLHNKFNTLETESTRNHHTKYLSMHEQALNEINSNNLQRVTQPPQANNQSHHKINTIENAYEIIYDQAKSIQTLQDKILNLQSELDLVLSKLKNHEDKDKSSTNCSCGRRSNNNVNNFVSTGTNTSLDLHNNNCNKSNSHSLSNNNQNASKRSIKAQENTSRSHHSQTKQNIKSEEDYRYDNFLNENSINFPKQFLDSDFKQEKEELTNYNINTTNTNMSHFNIIEKNYKLMQKNENIFTPTNNNNSLVDTINFNTEQSTVKEEILKNKIVPLKNMLDSDLKVKPLPSPNGLHFNMPNNIDITSTSIDPPSYRYFLKVPSLIYKSGNSILIDENFLDNPLRKKSIDTTRGNDYTINLPKIIYNDSLESFEENDIDS